MDNDPLFGGRQGSDGKATRHYGLYIVAFLELHGVDSVLSEHGGKIYFDIAYNEETRRLMKAFRGDEPVPILQFTRSLQRIRKRLFEVKKNIAQRPAMASNQQQGEQRP